MPDLSVPTASESLPHPVLRHVASGIGLASMGLAAVSLGVPLGFWNVGGIIPSGDAGRWIALAFIIHSIPWFTAYAVLSGAPFPDPVLEIIREEREACAQAVRSLAEIRGRQECCGVGVHGPLGGPPECCGNARLMIDAEDAIEAILKGGAAMNAKPRSEG